jgi:hypothetical protein
MVHMSVIEHRLSELGVRTSMLFKPEVNELRQILVDGETIVFMVPGRYFGGFALLVATDRRLLLIDKKAMFLTVEDIRYEMIAEVDFASRLMDCTMILHTVNKQHQFTSVKHKHKLRELTTFVQQKVMELRYSPPAQAAEQPEEQPPPEPMPPTTTDNWPVNHILASPLAATPTDFIHHPVKRLVGAAALHGTPWSHVNPYTQTSFMMRKKSSQLS